MDQEARITALTLAYVALVRELEKTGTLRARMLDLQFAYIEAHLPESERVTLSPALVAIRDAVAQPHPNRPKAPEWRI